MKLSEIKPNPDNPRVIKDEKFQQLKNSIEQSEGFGELNPIKVDRDMMIIGGNMRYRACQDLKIKDFPVVILTTKLYDSIIASRVKKKLETASATYEDVCREFVIKDNVSFGEHDWDALANDWDSEDLNDWGLDIPMNEQIDELEEGEEIEIPQSVQLEPPREYILIMADPNSVEWEEMKGELKLQIVRKGGYKKGSAFDTVGLERVIEWKDFKKRIDANSDTK